MNSLLAKMNFVNYGRRVKLIKFADFPPFYTKETVAVKRLNDFQSKSKIKYENILKCVDL